MEEGEAIILHQACIQFKITYNSVNCNFQASSEHTSFQRHENVFIVWLGAVVHCLTRFDRKFDFVADPKKTKAINWNLKIQKGVMACLNCTF